ncbi:MULTISPECIES: TetR/AcrR family transcriptional regulator [unclassified Sinorhizobium]|uniref:TetR/AcrR family transcriptional regulator n=1 Tax=unclassified Sinorhizobium TaxID=2613772 RepID=UPI0024C22DB5|nr:MULTISPECIES: TetR/AcrR family transcriptional regulator [unclassified Sinorhizobium]MDK1373572.1 TetR/AcrR family transcriptional regulator [Sinorhizobium sp. 6-70]MDK1480182.1 TetR/AcrR family transcriptional regulator [Sinorhizobium sp. 6-117]
MTEKTPAKERLLNAAAELFYREGVGATGIDAITAHAGVAKMSLYNNFSSKADLVNAYMQRRLDEWRDVYQERLRNATTPQERILAVFDSYVDHAALADEWGFRGCGLLNAAAELPVGDPGRAVVAFQKEEVERLFKEHLLEMRPGASVSIDDTAQHLSFLLEGAMSRAGLDGHDARLKTARKIANSILERL